MGFPVFIGNKIIHKPEENITNGRLTGFNSKISVHNRTIYNSANSGNICKLFIIVVKPLYRTYWSQKFLQEFLFLLLHQQLPCVHQKHQLQPQHLSDRPNFSAHSFERYPALSSAEYALLIILSLNSAKPGKSVFKKF